jgi:hypothetical protein
MSACACLQLTEATLAFPTEDIGRKEEITLWGPETLYAMPGAAAFMQGENAWANIYELSVEAGMHWDQGPYRSSLQEALTELDDPKESIQDPEIEAALDQWRAGSDTMDDLHEPSLFTEWNQAAGCSSFVGAAELAGKNMKIPEYTPEMLQQREDLNWFYNFRCAHHTFYPRDTLSTVVPDVEIEMEIVAAGESHAVAKCKYGSVFIPKGALKHIINLNYGQLSMEPLEIHKHRDEGGLVGELIRGSISFNEGKKHLWRAGRIECVME